MSARLNIGILVLALHLITGCSNLGKSYSEIDPEDALADMRKHNGYFNLKTVTPGTAKLVLRSEGFPANVSFSISDTEEICDFKILGSVRDSGHGVIYPWIADLVDSFSHRKEPLGFISTDLVPGKRVLIRGSGSWAGSGRPSTSGECGPLLSKFTPASDRAYLVRFTWEGNYCVQRVFDATDPDAPVLIPSEPGRICKSK